MAELQDEDEEDDGEDERHAMEEAAMNYLFGMPGTLPAESSGKDEAPTTKDLPSREQELMSMIGEIDSPLPAKGPQEALTEEGCDPPPLRRSAPIEITDSPDAKSKDPFMEMLRVAEEKMRRLGAQLQTSSSGTHLKSSCLPTQYISLCTQDLGSNHGLPHND